MCKEKLIGRVIIVVEQCVNDLDVVVCALRQAAPAVKVMGTDALMLVADIGQQLNDVPFPRGLVKVLVKVIVQGIEGLHIVILKHQLLLSSKVPQDLFVVEAEIRTEQGGLHHFPDVNQL